MLRSTINRWKANKLFLLTIATLVVISFTMNSVSAMGTKSDNQNSFGELLVDKEAEKYIKAIEQNDNFKGLYRSDNLVLNTKLEEKGAKVERIKLESDEVFKNDIVIVQSKVKNKKEHVGILAIVDAVTLDVLSYTTVEENLDMNGLVFTEYDGNSGEVLLKNSVVDNEIIESDIHLDKIKKGSYWWKVICNLATSGSCSLGCLALIAVPGGYPACTLLCSALAGATAC